MSKSGDSWKHRGDAGTQWGWTTGLRRLSHRDRGDGAPRDTRHTAGRRGALLGSPARVLQRRRELTKVRSLDATAAHDVTKPIHVGDITCRTTEPPSCQGFRWRACWQAACHLIQKCVHVACKVLTTSLHQNIMSN